MLRYHIKIYCTFDLIKKHPPEAETASTAVSRKVRVCMAKDKVQGLRGLPADKFPTN